MLPAPLRKLLTSRISGLITTPDVRKGGFGSSTLSRWVRAGLLERVVPQVYRDPRQPPPPIQHVAAAHLYALTRDTLALVTGHCALALMGVPGFSLAALPVVLVSHGMRLRLADATFTFLQTRQPCRLAMRVAGVGVTDPIRAVADLAIDPGVDDRTLVQALYDLRNMGLLEPVDAVERWRALGKHPGAVRLRGLVDQGVLEHESHAELDTFRRVFLAHPPPPDCQVKVTARHTVDYMYIFCGLVLEYYGEAAHADRVDHDATRIFTFKQLGLDALVITKSMTTDGVALANLVHDTRRRLEAEVLAGRRPRPALPVQPPRLTPLRTHAPFG